MKYFVPKFKLSADLPLQTELRDKVGGLPWGLTPEEYPVCSKCGKSQSLIIQLVHHRERLNLGRIGRTLLVFQCTHNFRNCIPSKGGSGSNACFIVEPENLVDEITPMPLDLPDLGIEAQIIDWIAYDDGIPPENVTPEGNLKGLSDEDDDYLDLEDKAYAGTMLGGVPFWVQDPGEAPSPRWNFVAQLDEYYELDEKPSSTAPNILDLMRRNHICFDRKNEKWNFTGPNLGCGLGYVFVRHRHNDKPEGWFFWQC